MFPRHGQTSRRPADLLTSVHQKVFGGYLMRLAYEVRDAQLVVPLSPLNLAQF